MAVRIEYDDGTPGVNIDDSLSSRFQVTIANQYASSSSLPDSGLKLQKITSSYDEYGVTGVLNPEPDHFSVIPDSNLSFEISLLGSPVANGDFRQRLVDAIRKHSEKTRFEHNHLRRSNPPDGAIPALIRTYPDNPNSATWGTLRRCRIIPI